VQLPTFMALAQVRPNEQGLHTMKCKSCTIDCCGDQLHKH